MRLDHFVIHIEPKPDAIGDIAKTCIPLGFAFDPVGNRNFDSFSAHYLYVGFEYLEIIQLKNPETSGWVPRWVQLFKEGHRGIYCIFLGTQDIEEIERNLVANGFEVKAERSSFVAGDGKEYQLPWRIIHLPAIPGSPTEISFIQYDSSPQELKEIFVPNSDQNSLVGIHGIELFIPNVTNQIDFIRKIFPNVQVEDLSLIATCDNGFIRFSNDQKIQSRIHVKSDDLQKIVQQFSIENIVISVDN